MGKKSKIKIKFDKLLTLNKDRRKEKIKTLQTV